MSGNYNDLFGLITAMFEAAFSVAYFLKEKYAVKSH